MRGTERNLRQGGFIPAFLLPYLWKIVGGLAILALAAYVVHRYNERIRTEARTPLLEQIDVMTKAIDANKKEAARLMVEREAENQKALEGYIDYARKSDDEYERKIADIRARANTAGGVRLYDPGSRNRGCTTGQTGQGSTATPEAAAGTDRLREGAADEAGAISPETSAFLLGLMRKANEAQAYAESCHRFVNEK